MGAAGSKEGAGAATAESPFPLSPALDNDLNKLSVIVARILNTPDIYEIENLSRTGACGDYVVFLRDKVTREVDSALQRFALTDASSGERTEILYANPRKLLNDKVRDRLCKSLTDSLLRTITIVVACLASIQVAGPGRKAAVERVPPPVPATTTAQQPQVLGGLARPQLGGGMIDVRDWLVQKQYIAPSDIQKPAGTRMELQIRTPALITRKIRMYLTLTATTGPMTVGYFQAEGGPKGEELPEEGVIRVHFLNPIAINGTSQTVLPIRLFDKTHLTWAAGMLVDGAFKSFYTEAGKAPQQYDLMMMLEALYRRAQGWQVDWPEIPTQTRTADATFNILYRSGTPETLWSAMGSYFQGRAAPAAAPYGAPAGPYGAPPQPLYPGAPAYGVQQQQFAPAYGAQQPLIRQALQYAIPPAVGATTGRAQNLLERFQKFRGQFATESSPAVTRALSLAGSVTANRDVQTNLCKDTYWSQTTMKEIHPWAALQLLCISDLTALASADRSRVPFEPEWQTFLDRLGSIYNGSGAPLLVRGKDQFLDQIRITNVERLPVCATGQTAIVKFKEVNDGLLRLQGLYDRHVATVWKILNSLIAVIVDPDTKEEHIRLHPSLVNAESSTAYVNERAKAARQAIATFYADVEEVYVTTAKSLRMA